MIVPGMQRKTWLDRIANMFHKINSSCANSERKYKSTDSSFVIHKSTESVIPDVHHFKVKRTLLCSKLV